MIRETLIEKIGLLEGILADQRLSRWSKERAEINIKALKEDLAILDRDGDIAMVQQMKLEANL